MSNENISSDDEILEHEKKRRIEVKCMEMRDMMLNNG